MKEVVRRSKGSVHVFDDSRVQEEEDRLSLPLARIQPMKDDHNSGNEEPLHFRLHSSNQHFVFYRPQNFSFPSRRVLSISVGELHLACHSCRPQMSFFLLTPK